MMMVLFRQALILVATIAAALDNQIQIAEAIDIGVCYGMLGDNLPPATDVVNLYKKYGIQKTRLFDPNPSALNALRGSRISVILGIRNEDLPNLAVSQAAVTACFSTNVEPYLKDIEFPVIAVGNEIIPGVFAQNILPVMQFLQTILDDKGQTGIKVSTVVSAALGKLFPAFKWSIHSRGKRYTERCSHLFVATGITPFDQYLSSFRLRECSG